MTAAILPQPTLNFNGQKPSSPTQQQQQYTFASQPRGARRASNVDGPVNIMHDRRIHRGSTYAAPALPATAQPDPVTLQKQQAIKQRAAERRASLSKLTQRLETPSPPPNRQHMTIQTELYLEDLSDKVPEAAIATQTDAFLDRAPSPLYVPKKSGLDVATQIEEGELFDFNFEVQPILEVLVGKTLEQALMEVMEEEELDALRAHQRDFEERRNAEIIETQRLEAAERRRIDEKERRLHESLRLQAAQQALAEKIASHAFAHSYLSDLVPTVFENLAENGYFYDQTEREVETAFLPWLTGEVEKNLDKTRTAAAVLDGLLRQALESKWK